jgi:hypothetical protein
MDKKQFIEFYDKDGKKLLGLPAIRTIKPQRRNILDLFNAHPEFAYATLNGRKYTFAIVCLGLHGTKEA